MSFLKYVSYRNLSEPGGPEFTNDEAKAIAASFEITDGPNSDGEMFTRPGRLSDKLVMPYKNEEEAKAANGGAYPPDMSVLVKARKEVQIMFIPFYLVTINHQAIYN